VELVKALLAHGANPNAKATKNPPRFGNTNFRLPLAGGATPFFVAAMAADTEMMRLLLASGADPMPGLKDGTTALMVAAGYGRIPAESSVSEAVALEAVKFLLSLGNQNVNAVNQAGDAALHGVAYIGADKILRLLVDNGANVNVVNKRGLTPLLIADGHGDRTVLTTVVFHKSMATMLREMGADEKLGVPIE
jgi:ankyrin repeat protein